MNRIFAMEAARPASEKNPKNPATSARIKKVNAQPSMA
jgi:hypothetical protein